jgi:hypothetical protein
MVAVDATTSVGPTNSDMPRHPSPISTTTRAVDPRRPVDTLIPVPSLVGLTIACPPGPSPVGRGALAHRGHSGHSEGWASAVLAVGW